MRLLITGATGLIGKVICRLLADDGHQIVVLSRRPEKARVLPVVGSFHWEPAASLPPNEAWEGVEGVIHLAGEPVIGLRWTDELKRRIRDSRVIGTRNLVNGIRGVSSRPKVLISASAVGYYGNRGKESLNELSPAGKGFLSDICQEWEREAAKAQELSLRVSCIRVGIVLSRDGGALERMLPPFKLGIGGRLGSGEQWFPWIHINDIAGIFRHALLTPSLNGPINGVAPGIVTNEELTKELAAVLHRPSFFPVPELALQILMGEMAEVIMMSQRVAPKVVLESGYQFNYPELRPALQNLLIDGRET